MSDAHLFTKDQLDGAREGAAALRGLADLVEARQHSSQALAFRSHAQAIEDLVGAQPDPPRDSTRTQPKGDEREWLKDGYYRKNISQWLGM